MLLGLSLAMLPITPSDSWKAHVGGDPNLRILLLLMATIGLPYFVLSSTGPLMQQWFSQTNPGVSPYRLYALSNVGSLLALLSYPVFFEVKFPRHTQAAMWSGGLVLFVLFCGYCVSRLEERDESRALAHSPCSHRSGASTRGSCCDLPLRREHSRSVRPFPGALDTPSLTGDSYPPDTPAPSATPAVPAALPSANGEVSVVDKLLWVSLPAIASVLLLATTNKLSQEVAVIPFLWVLPLNLYLLSFIICFDHARWYNRGIFTALLVVATAVVCQVLPVGNDAPMKLQIFVYNAALFMACMVCHGELYRSKPPPRQLTAYFLFISAGGALGGFLVAIVAPATFKDYRELQLGLWVLWVTRWVCCAFAIAAANLPWRRGWAPS